MKALPWKQVPLVDVMPRKDHVQVLLLFGRLELERRVRIV